MSPGYSNSYIDHAIEIISRPNLVVVFVEHQFHSYGAPFYFGLSTIYADKTHDSCIHLLPRDYHEIMYQRFRYCREVARPLLRCSDALRGLAWGIGLTNKGPHKPEEDAAEKVWVLTWDDQVAFDIKSQMNRIDRLDQFARDSGMAWKADGPISM